MTSPFRSLYFPKRSMRYAISGPSSPAYASCAIASEDGSRYRATCSSPASTECGDDVGPSNLPRQRLCTRRGVGNGQRGVVRVHRKRARDDHCAGEVAGLLQHVVDSRPVHGQQQHIRIQGGLTRRARPRVSPRLSSKSLHLPLAARVAEAPRDDVNLGSHPRCGGSPFPRSLPA